MSKFLQLCLFLFSATVFAEDMRPASLNIIAIDNEHYDVIWKVPAVGNKRLSMHVIFDENSQNASAKKQDFINGAYIESWQIKRDNGLTGLTVNIDGLLTTNADVLVRIVDQQQQSITQVLNAEHQQLHIEGNFEPENVIGTYTYLGIEHILIGLDHLLFVACLVYISSTRRKLLLTISGFTLAHSVTLFLAATETFALSIPPVEAVIALSIVFLAIEIAKRKENSLTLKYPVLVSSSFGLIHGFGFASVLAEIGLPVQEKITALIFFNVGVEIGQLMFLAVLLVTFKMITHSKLLSAGQIRWLVSYSCGGIAMIWLVQRLGSF
ncbi:HupE/UreJ family protein [Thalassotalea sp. PLHSN55]|uniref:HupE/UreJ family protein n=1 Tax=Thalassotalea sp. PLHSN55 TaxID=3435888 RepID=UPI003F8377B4